MEKVRRCIVFLLGLFINSMGVGLITKANLGTSPISAIPYVLSLRFSLSLGEFTILFSLLLVAAQLLILRNQFKPEHWLQVPVSIAFGYFIDFGLWVMKVVRPQTYGGQVTFLLIGCLVLSVGVFLEVIADVVMLPGESFVRAVVYRRKMEFGVAKVVFDVSMTVIAAGLSVCLQGKLSGVREGTIIAAVLVGFLARQIGRKLEWLSAVLFHSDKQRTDYIRES